MTIRTWTGLACAALAALILLPACGGGSSGPTAGVGIGGTGKTGVAFGSVDTAGGVRVGGTLFDTQAATVRIGGSAAAVADLRDGHVALVEGILAGTTGRADTITVEEVIKGRLEARPGANVLTVQGQTVEIDERTAFGAGIVPSSADGLTIGDLLEVWGFVKGPGLVRATRIEREDTIDEIRIVGIARNVDTVGDRFDIGGQAIDHGSADVSELPGGDPVDNELVRVRGEGVLNGDGSVNATRVEPIGIAKQEDNDATELEGYVTAVFPGVGFRIGSDKVQVTAETKFVGGDAAEIVIGLELEVEGAIENGVLVARVVQFRSGVDIETAVAGVAGELITLQGLPGLVVRVDGLTEFKGDATKIGDLLPGDYVKIRARVAGPATAVAVEVDETSPDSSIKFQGPVGTSPPPSDPLFSLLGVAIDTSGIPESGFESPNGDVIGRAGFFAGAQPGRLVEVSGELVGGNAVWDEAELEDE